MFERVHGSAPDIAGRGIERVLATSPIRTPTTKEFGPAIVDALLGFHRGQR